MGKFCIKIGRAEKSKRYLGMKAIWSSQEVKTSESAIMFRW